MSETQQLNEPTFEPWMQIAAYEIAHTYYMDEYADILENVTAPRIAAIIASHAPPQYNLQKQLNAMAFTSKNLIEALEIELKELRARKDEQWTPLKP